MSDDNTFALGKLIPGFDFLQQLTSTTKGASKSAPGLRHWIAPTVSVEELDKRITELRAVQFWLEQNLLALKATIQALEVQKMTLATLRDMNLSVTEVAKAFTLPKSEERAAPAAPPAPPAAAPRARAGRKDAAASSGGVADPMQWWGALTQQFQQIAAGAMKEAATNTAVDATRHMATGLAREAVKAASNIRIVPTAPKSERT